MCNQGTEHYMLSYVIGHLLIDDITPHNSIEIYICY